MPAHRLGPHIVGQRVVLRRLVPGETGPTGGPAFTDVLGVLLAWPAPHETDGVAVVRDADGVEHTVPVDLVVSGKPVPPRPSVLDRVPPERWQHVAARTLPAATTETLGSWLLRDDQDRDPATGRAGGVAHLSSALAVGDPGCDLPTAVQAVHDWYARRGREPWACVVEDSPAHEAFLRSGWRPAAEDVATQTWVGSVSRCVRALDADPAVRATDPATASGDDRLHAAAGGPGRLVTDPADPDTVGLVGRLAASGTAPDRAARLLHTLLEDAAARGARTVWTHLDADDNQAHDLHRRAGMRPHHTTLRLRGGGSPRGR